jgi:hypothetical protein
LYFKLLTISPLQITDLQTLHRLAIASKLITMLDILSITMYETHPKQDICSGKALGPCMALVSAFWLDKALDMTWWGRVGTWSDRELDMAFWLEDW